jgi:hypothetical protein
LIYMRKPNNTRWIQCGGNPVAHPRSEIRVAERVALRVLCPVCAVCACAACGWF